MNSFSRLVAATAFISLFAACGDKAGDSAALTAADGILKYIPADSPYVIATPGEFPEDVSDKLEPQLDAILVAYHQMLRAMAENAYAQAKAEGGDVEVIETMLPVINELESLMSVDGLREAGIDRESDFAFYGMGLLPVTRITLTDGRLFEAALDRLEASAGSNMKTAEIDGTRYRFAGNDEGRLIIAVIDNDLVITLVPTGLSEAQMKNVVGLTIPANNIGAAGTLGKIADTYGFDDYMVGYIDVERLAATFLDEQSGINAELLALSDYQAPALSDICKAEIRSIAGVMPRIVTGYSDISTEKLVSQAVFELRSDLAQGVASLTAPVPGLGASHGGLFSIGMSMDLMAMRSFYESRLDALEADPYRCELLADLQQGVASGRAALNQPVPPVVYGLRGFLAVVDGFEGMNLAANMPPTSIDMQFLLATENAEALLAMGAMFSPEIASLGLQSGGEPVRLDLPPIAATGQVVYAALADEGIAISVGEGMQDGLDTLLKSPAGESSTFLAIDMDAERYYAFINEAIAADPAGDADADPAVKAAVQDVMTAVQKMFSRSSFVVRFTEKGIEMESEATLAD